MKNHVLSVLFVLCLGTSDGLEVHTAKCPNGQFSCGNSSYCVERRFNCDGIIHCPNGADEEDCNDLSGVIKDAFGILQKDMNHSKTINMTGCILGNYPKACACQFETTINCRGSNFTSIPIDLDKNVQVLMMRKNNIANITADQLQLYQKLHVLFLDENGIKDISPGVFSNVKLMTLSLAKNKISVLRDGVFQGLKNSLKTLFLNNNRIQYFDSSIISGFEILQELHLEHNQLTLKDSNFKDLPNLRLMHLDHNSIKRIDKEILSSLTSVIGLFLDYNEIEVIESGAFMKLKKLKELNLGYNKIKTIPENVFQGLNSLTSLKLRHNPITAFSESTFEYIKELESLYLENVAIDGININLFKPLKRLNRIHFKRFHYCSYVPSVRICEPRSDGLSSTQHLLVKPILRVSIWIVATITCIGNTVVLLGRAFLSSHGEEISHVSLLFIKNLSAADLMMGIYLFVVASKDIDFRDTYNANAHAWMSSVACTVCGVVAMTSSEVSVFTLSFMSIERHSRIVHPLNGFGFSVKRAYVVILTIWLLGLTIAVAPILLWGIKEPTYKFYGSNGFCFPLHMADPFKMGWQYSAFVFLGINFIGVFIISYSYISMYFSIQNTRSDAQCKKVEMDLAKRFFFIVITDCLCWIPIIILKIIALTKTDIPQDLYAWVVVFILPVNSAMNPIIYSISSKSFWRRMRELLKQKITWPSLTNSKTRSCIYRAILFNKNSQTDSVKRQASKNNESSGENQNEEKL